MEKLPMCTYCKRLDPDPCGWIGQAEECQNYDEREQHLHVKGASPDWHEGPVDTMAAFADQLNEDDARQRRWDLDYLALARFWAEQKSKDPSTQVGAVVVSVTNKVVGLGYNGFPVGVADHPDRYDDRPTKYAMVVHAEPNALLSAGVGAWGGTIYCTLSPCNECAKLIIQAGIKRVVAYNADPGGGASERWVEAHRISSLMFDEAGVTAVLL